MKNDSVINRKATEFALRIIKAYQFLTTEKNEYVMSKQLLRSGTAIGALIREAEFAESKNDFAHKLRIALKEANETDYWLLLLSESNYIEKRRTIPSSRTVSNSSNCWSVSSKPPNPIHKCIRPPFLIINF